MENDFKISINEINSVTAKRSFKRKTILIFFQIIIAVFFLHLTFHTINFKNLTHIFSTVNYKMLLLSLAAQGATFWILAAREKYLLAKLYAFKFHDLLKSVFISYIGNNLLPFRAGEFLKVYYWKKISGRSYLSLFSIGLLERIIDLTILVILFLAGSEKILAPLGVKTSYVLVVFVVSIFPIALLVILDYRHQKTFSFNQRTKLILGESIAEYVEEIINKLMTGLRVLGSLKNTVITIALSILYWIVNLASLMFILSAFHLSFSISQSLIVLLATALGVAIPSAPGYIGTFDYFAKSALMLYGVNESISTSFAITAHFISIVPYTLLILCFLYPTLSAILNQQKNSEINDE
jgi:hypothetical protein